MTIELTTSQKQDRTWRRAKNYYPRETKTFKDCKLYNTKLKNKQAQIYTNRLLGDREIFIDKIVFSGKKFHRSDYKHHRIIYISNGVTIGIVCHEVAHYIQEHINGKTDHTDTLMLLVFDLLHEIKEIEYGAGLLGYDITDYEIPPKPTLEMYFNGNTC